LTAPHQLPARPGRGFAAGLVGVFLWSWTGVLIAHLLRTEPLAPMTLAFWRDAFVAAALGAGLGLLRPAALRLDRRHRAFLGAYGLALVAMNFTWTWSVAWNGAAVSTVLVYASPGLTALAARWRYREPLSPLRGVAFAASLAGCVLVARAHDPAAWRLNGLGIATGLLSAAAFTLYSMMGRSAARRGIDPWAATLAVFSVAALVLLPVALLSLPPAGPAASLLSLGGRAPAWGLLALLAVVPTIGGYGLYTVSLQHLPAATANLIATLEPALTAVWAWWLLGESLAPVQLAGGALIVGSVLILRREEKG